MLPVKYSIFHEAISSSGVFPFVSGILAGVAAVQAPDGIGQSVTSLFRGNPVAAALFSEGRTRESRPIISVGLILYHLKNMKLLHEMMPIGVHSWFYPFSFCTAVP